MNLAPCPACNVSAAKLRTGTLGKLGGGVWCSNCGHSTPTVEAWAPAPQQIVDMPVMISDPIPVFDRTPYLPGGPYWDLLHYGGQDLDIAGAKHLGMHRNYLESDDDYRARLWAQLQP